MESADAPRFTITRTTVVRVEGPVDEEGVQLLGRMLSDLIDDQGITDLVVDLSDVGDLPPGLATVLERARCRVADLGGLLEVRTPAAPPTELVEAMRRIPMFSPLESDGPELPEV